MSFVSFLFTLFTVHSCAKGVVVREGNFTDEKSAFIYTKSWEPASGEPIAQVLFVHGQGEHINRYNHVFSKFAKEGIKVTGFDQIGCGLTGKHANDLGGAMGMARVRLDIDNVLNKDSKTPLFLMGHSFGGLTVLDYLARGESREHIYAGIASAPDLELSRESKPGFFERAMLRSVASVTPTLKVSATIDTSYLSRDPSQVELYNNDPLVFSECAAIQVYDTVFGGEYLLKGGYRNITVPRLLIAHGNDDKITSFAASETLVEELTKLGNQQTLTFKPFDGAYHELHNDIIKDEVIKYYIAWIKSVLVKPEIVQA
ncbi:hypothetical protein DSO57_1000419 [Entomophthora muscae]|uniref:Uncharacterized protein n=1 Tax=Entomophthora muscae TaxID=34485 RepID=A0ACC2UIZ5_9FUNG|nr:hypothetical protein DSO57_1000419 [Entomophthora muscae]